MDLCFVCTPAAISVGSASSLAVEAKACSAISARSAATRKTKFSLKKSDSITFSSEKRFFNAAAVDDLGFFKSSESKSLLNSQVVMPEEAFTTGPMANFGWFPVLPSSALAPGEKTNVFIPFQSGETTGVDVLIVRDFQGQVYAVSNACPHLGTPLNTGKITQDGSIVCSQHRSAWSLKTGEVKGEWCPFPPVLGKVFAAVAPPTPLLTYGARESAGGIEVYIDLDAKKQLEAKTYGSYFRGTSE